MKNIEIALVVAVIDMLALVQVSGKDVRVFVDGAVLNNGFLAFADLSHLVKPTVQKIDLQVKRPARHVFIEIAQVWILVNRFIERSPAVMFGKFFYEGSFPTTNIARNGNVFKCFQKNKISLKATQFSEIENSIQVLKNCHFMLNFLIFAA